VGADARSKNFYLRVKGEVEQSLERMGFQSLDILQPGPLLGWRRNELRPLELLASAFMPLTNSFFTGSRMRLRGVPARIVAAAAVGAARSGRRGVYRYTTPSLQQLADSKPVRR
jgi:uncharacterized protein YbjT (DUF2867 family)